MRSGCKLQLDAPALERLLGGNTKLELELRQTVVEEFARKHIKALVADQHFESSCQTAAESVKQELNQIIENQLEQIGIKLEKTYGKGYKIVLPEALRQSVRDMIQLELNNMIKQVISDCIQSSLQELDLNAMISTELKSQSTLLVQHLVVKQAQNIIDQICDIAKGAQNISA